MIVTILNKTFQPTELDADGNATGQGVWQVDVAVNGDDGSRRAVETIPGNATDKEKALLAELNARWGVKA